MSKSYREEHPLLREESDEELQIRQSPKFHRRLRYLTPGRARAQIKGVAAIVTHWPDHLSTLLTYWWIGLAMIAVLIFIIYNSIVAVAVLPPIHPKPSKFQDTEHIIKNKESEQPVSNVFMHIFVSNYEELNMNDYIPYLETFANKHPNFKYNFIVLLNDATKESMNDLSNELENEMALNSLWTENKTNNVHKLNEYTTIRIIPLSRYMDQSPLKKYWRRLPKQFLGFLSRCISIWDKGGVAFNPIILTPKSPSPINVEKLEQILNLKENRMHNRNLFPKKTRKTVNNIQDIIETLQNESNNNNFAENMLEVENKEKVIKIEYPIINKIKRNTKPFTTNSKYTTKIIQHLKRNMSDLQVPDTKEDFNPLLSTTIENDRKSDLNDIEIISERTTTQSIFPIFLELFLNQTKLKNLNVSSKNQTMYGKHFRQNKNLSLDNSLRQQINSHNKSSSEKEPLKVMKNKKGMDVTDIHNINQLTVDLQGNLIATETPCHAFIGTIFSNVIRHTDEESVKDFIITELSIFCKGVLSSCKGIEVILS